MIVEDVLHLNARLLAYQGVDLWSVARRVATALNAQALAFWLGCAFLVGLVALLVRLLRRTRGELSLLGRVGILLTVSLVISYHRPYDFVALIVPLFWTTTLAGSVKWRAILWGSVLPIFLPGLMIPYRWAGGTAEAQVRWFIDVAAFCSVLGSNFVLAFGEAAHDAAVEAAASRGG